MFERTFALYELRANGAQALTDPFTQAVFAEQVELLGADYAVQKWLNPAHLDICGW